MVTSIQYNDRDVRCKADSTDRRDTITYFWGVGFSTRKFRILADPQTNHREPEDFALPFTTSLNYKGLHISAAFGCGLCSMIENGLRNAVVGTNAMRSAPDAHRIAPVPAVCQQGNSSLSAVNTPHPPIPTMG